MASNDMMNNMSAVRKLVLHFDVNETIMVGDPAGGDTFEESLNKCICKNAFIKKRVKVNGDEEDMGRWSEYTWHDGSSLDPKLRKASSCDIPPLITTFDTGDNECFYKNLPLKDQYAKIFTNHEDSPGFIYRDLYNSIEKAMRIPEGCDIDPRLTHDGVHYLVRGILSPFLF